MLTASGVARKLAQKVHAAKGSGYQCIVLISLRKVRKNFRLHLSVTRVGCRGTSVVSWRAWSCAELALLMLALLHALGKI